MAAHPVNWQNRDVGANPLFQFMNPIGYTERRGRLLLYFYSFWVTVWITIIFPDNIKPLEWKGLSYDDQWTGIENVKTFSYYAELSTLLPACVAAVTFRTSSLSKASLVCYFSSVWLLLHCEKLLGFSFIAIICHYVFCALKQLYLNPSNDCLCRFPGA